jgi:hypothetical protein
MLDTTSTGRSAAELSQRWGRGVSAPIPRARRRPARVAPRRRRCGHGLRDRCRHHSAEGSSGALTERHQQWAAAWSPARIPHTRRGFRDQQTRMRPNPSRDCCTDRRHRLCGAVRCHGRGCAPCLRPYPKEFRQDVVGLPGPVRTGRR